MRAVIPYAGGELEATLHGETWFVRLGELEEASPYLDYALTRLLDIDTRQVHQLATRLIGQLLISPKNGHGSQYLVVIDGAEAEYIYQDERRPVIEREVLMVDARNVVAERVTQPEKGHPGRIYARPLPTRR